MTAIGPCLDSEKSRCTRGFMGSYLRPFRISNLRMAPLSGTLLLFSRRQKKEKKRETVERDREINPRNIYILPTISRKIA